MGNLDWQLKLRGAADLRTAWLCADLVERHAPTTPGDWSRAVAEALGRVCRLAQLPPVQLWLAQHAPRVAALAGNLDPHEHGSAMLRMAAEVHLHLLRLAMPGPGAATTVIDPEGPRSRLALTARLRFGAALRPEVLERLRAHCQNQLLNGALLEFQVRLGSGAVEARVRELLSAHLAGGWCAVDALTAALAEALDWSPLQARGQVRDWLLEQVLETGLERPAEPRTGLAGLIDQLDRHAALKPVVERLRELGWILEGEWTPETLLRAGVESECRQRMAELLPGWMPGDCVVLQAHRQQAGVRLDPRPLAGWLEALGAAMPFLATRRPGREAAGAEAADSRWQQLLLERVLDARDREQTLVRLRPEELRSLWRHSRAPARAGDRRLQARLSLWPSSSAAEALAELCGLRFAPERTPRQPGKDLTTGRLAGLRQSLVLHSMRSLPRIQVGSLLLERACWRVSEAEANELAAGGEPVARWLRLQGWRQQRGIPRHVQAVIDHSALELDLDCPLSTQLLLGQLDQEGALVLAEGVVAGADAPVTEAGHPLRHELRLGLAIQSIGVPLLAETDETPAPDLVRSLP